MAVLLITHDLGVVWEIAQRVIVMYAGRKVEEGTAADVFDDPQHPYTRGLLPRGCLRERQRRTRCRRSRGTVPSPFEMPPGCRFAPRCPQVRGDLPRRAATTDPACAGHDGGLRSGRSAAP